MSTAPMRDTATVRMTVPDVSQVHLRTEMAAARRFAVQHGENLRYVPAWKKWLVWDGTRWKVDDSCAVEALAKRTAVSIWNEIVDEIMRSDRSTISALTSFGKSISSATGINHMIELAQSEPGIAITPEKLESHPWLFNCRNGTVDLKSGQLLPHNREHYLMKICPHPYVQGAESECPIWDEAVTKILNDKAELVGFAQRFLGSALVGEVIEHILAIFWGDGSNGKSIIVEMLLEALGEDYAIKGADELLLQSTGSRHPTEKADLYGKRLVICNETDEGRRLAEGVVKSLTGGDTVSARRMKEDFWRFKPSHTLILVTNHKPLVKGNDHGIWRRLRLVPFTQKFWDPNKGESGPPELEADLQLKDRLRPELPGIVRWLVDGCLAWQRNGLGQPHEVTAATAEYREAMDQLAAFIRDRCTLHQDAHVKAKDLREAYSEWCDENGEKPLSTRKLGESLAAKGITKIQSNGTKYFGIGLQADQEQTE